MVTPEVVGHIDPVELSGSKRTGSLEIDVPGWSARPTVIQRIPPSDVVADLGAEHVAKEGQGCVRVSAPLLLVASDYLVRQVL